MVAAREPLIECPVCGHVVLTVRPFALWPPPLGLKLAPPYEEFLGRPSYEVCSRCSFEFGNDDNPGTAAGQSFAEYRREWEVLDFLDFVRTAAIGGISLGAAQIDVAASLGEPSDMSVTRPLIWTYPRLELAFDSGRAYLITLSIERPAEEVEAILRGAGLNLEPAPDLTEATQVAFMVLDAPVTVTLDLERPLVRAFASN